MSDKTEVAVNVFQLTSGILKPANSELYLLTSGYTKVDKY